LLQNATPVPLLKSIPQRGAVVLNSHTDASRALRCAESCVAASSRLIARHHRFMGRVPLNVKHPTSHGREPGLPAPCPGLLRLLLPRWATYINITLVVRRETVEVTRCVVVALVLVVYYRTNPAVLVSEVYSKTTWGRSTRNQPHLVWRKALRWWCYTRWRNVRYPPALRPTRDKVETVAIVRPAEVAGEILPDDELDVCEHPALVTAHATLRPEPIELQFTTCLPTLCWWLALTDPILYVHDA